MSEWQIEMHWYCATCKHDNKGRELTCGNCGKPRENEQYLMPDDTSEAAAVTDGKLLGKAKAGPNWHCRYCRSSQRRSDGSCKRCGAPSAEGTAEGDELPDLRLPPPPRLPTPTPVSREVEEPAPFVMTPWEFLREHRWFAITLTAVLSAAALLWWFVAPHDARVTVAAVSWAHTVEIERYKITGENGWSAPGDAFNVRNEGPRVHHYDHRPVGSHLERYTVQVACGQTCVPIPRSCYSTCTSNKNGFATCRQSCSGGGQSCSTRYCSEGRTRTIIDYQDFPIFQSWYSWQAWRWLHQRDVALSGATNETRWPSVEEEHLREGLLDREDEREGLKRAEYRVTYARGDEQWVTNPTQEGEFRKRALGSRWRIEVNRLGMVGKEQRE